MYKYQVVTRSSIDTMSVDELKDNFTISGWSDNSCQREELKNQPKLQGFVGPMYNGVEGGHAIIRYESLEEYSTYD